jgi:hypothetical protein
VCFEPGYPIIGALLGRPGAGEPVERLIA